MPRHLSVGARIQWFQLENGGISRPSHLLPFCHTDIIESTVDEVNAHGTTEIYTNPNLRLVLVSSWLMKPMSLSRLSHGRWGSQSLASTSRPHWCSDETPPMPILRDNRYQYWDWVADTSWHVEKNRWGDWESMSWHLSSLVKQSLHRYCTTAACPSVKLPFLAIQASSIEQWCQ